jgi:hypothetical protein
MTTPSPLPPPLGPSWPVPNHPSYMYGSAEFVEAGDWQGEIRVSVYDALYQPVATIVSHDWNDRNGFLGVHSIAQAAIENQLQLIEHSEELPCEDQLCNRDAERQCQDCGRNFCRGHLYIGKGRPLCDGCDSQLTYQLMKLAESGR